MTFDQLKPGDTITHKASGQKAVILEIKELDNIEYERIFYVLSTGFGSNERVSKEDLLLTIA